MVEGTRLIEGKNEAEYVGWTDTAGKPAKILDSKGNEMQANPISFDTAEVNQSLLPAVFNQLPIITEAHVHVDDEGPLSQLRARVGRARVAVPVSLTCPV